MDFRTAYGLQIFLKEDADFEERDRVVGLDDGTGFQRIIARQPST